MNKILLALCLLPLIYSKAQAETNCFLAKEKNQVIKQEGSDCKTRFAPESTFKIVLSLMGYDAGVLIDETNPEWPYKKEYQLYVNVWKDPHNPQTWIRDSCVWYSQVLTQKLGMNRFQDYVLNFRYGNQDVSGDKGANNGLTQSWLSSSLEISPEEQIVFLQKIIEHKLPINSKAYDMTKKNLFIQELAGGWKLYGKTGNGRQLTADKSKKTPLQHGWFVGWIEKNDRVITFAEHIKDDKEMDVFASFRARNETLTKLWYLIDEIEKP